MYSSKRDFLELVLFRLVRVLRQVMRVIVAHVTITAPLALTQRKRTWAADILRRSAAFSSAASTGPSGKVVRGLCIPSVN